MKTCLGITKEIRFCRKPVSRGLLCHVHRRQPLYFLLSALVAILFSYVAGLFPIPWANEKIAHVSENERLKRIEFLHDCSNPLMGINVVLMLKRECTPKDLSHFRFLVEILNLHEPEPHPGLWIAGRDAYYIRHNKGVSQQVMGIKSLVWSQNPDEQIQNTIFGTGAMSTDQLEAGGHLYKRGPYKTLGDLDQRCMAIYVTKPLLDLTAGIYVKVNDYWIAGNTAERFVPLEISPLVTLPEPLSEIYIRGHHTYFLVNS